MVYSRTVLGQYLFYCFSLCSVRKLCRWFRNVRQTHTDYAKGKKRGSDNEKKKTKNQRCNGIDRVEYTVPLPHSECVWSQCVFRTQTCARRAHTHTPASPTLASDPLSLSLYLSSRLRVHRVSFSNFFSFEWNIKWAGERQRNSFTKIIPFLIATFFLFFHCGCCCCCVDTFFVLTGTVLFGLFKHRKTPYALQLLSSRMQTPKQNKNS